MKCNNPRFQAVVNCYNTLSYFVIGREPENEQFLKNRAYYFQQITVTTQMTVVMVMMTVRTRIMMMMMVL